MIWLKEKNTLSSYNISTLDSDKLDELKSELNKPCSYELVESEIVITSNRVFDEYKDGFITKYFDTDISRCQYLKKRFKNKYPVSGIILDNINSTAEFDLSKLIDLFSFEYTCLKKVSNYSDSFLKAYLTEKINQDLYFFTYKIFDILKFEKVSEHDLNRLKQIKELSFGVVDTNCDYYLDKVPISEYNSKVIALVKRLK